MDNRCTDSPYRTDWAKGATGRTRAPYRADQQVQPTDRMVASELNSLSCVQWVPNNSDKICIQKNTSTQKGNLETGRAKGHVLCTGRALSVHVPAMLLQVHAVDEIIRLLCGEGAGLLQLVADQPQTAANHEQQQSRDDQAQNQWQDRT